MTQKLKLASTLVFLLTLAQTLQAYRQPTFVDRLRIDLNGNMIVPASSSAVIGPGFGFGFATRDIDIMLLTRMGLYDLDQTVSRQLYQGLLRADIKFRFNNTPLILLAGIGFGASYGADLSRPGVDSVTNLPLKFTGIGQTFELSSGVLFPLNQTIAATARLGYASTSFSPDSTTSVSIGGPSLEIGVRIAFGPTVELNY
ncbi:MAG: hypothetical protein KDK41_02025 [Leptospiraceae bacterium]|nr:hypothetical protein [Leptospiraceae bacterium]